MWANTYMYSFTMLANPTPTFFLATPTLLLSILLLLRLRGWLTSGFHPCSYSYYTFIGTHGRDTADFVTPIFKWRNSQSFDLN